MIKQAIKNNCFVIEFLTLELKSQQDKEASL